MAFGPNSMVGGSSVKAWSKNTLFSVFIKGQTHFSIPSGARNEFDPQRTSGIMLLFNQIQTLPPNMQHPIANEVERKEEIIDSVMQIDIETNNCLQKLSLS